ncbi:MAG: hypothetical protein PF572_05155 [Patescibacteria group bacterium]|jgi:hypothetical protein|nr:hypothetical protein [Patescibacteria group bacterium]
MARELWYQSENTIQSVLQKIQRKQKDTITFGDVQCMLIPSGDGKAFAGMKIRTMYCDKKRNYRSKRNGGRTDRRTGQKKDNKAIVEFSKIMAKESLNSVRVRKIIVLKGKNRWIIEEDKISLNYFPDGYGSESKRLYSFVWQPIDKGETKAGDMLKLNIVGSNDVELFSSENPMEEILQNKRLELKLFMYTHREEKLDIAKSILTRQLFLKLNIASKLTELLKISKLRDLSSRI